MAGSESWKAANDGPFSGTKEVQPVREQDFDQSNFQDGGGVAVAVRPKQQDKQKRKKQPRYQVLLWDDNDHSYGYVIKMMQELFGKTIEDSIRAAIEVDTSGCHVCLITTLEHAELKQQQIHSFGRDGAVARCKGAMTSTIEPIES